MEMVLFLQDLSDDTLCRIRWVVAVELASEMGIDDPAEVPNEAIDDYLNRNNVGIRYCI